MLWLLLVLGGTVRYKLSSIPPRQFDRESNALIALSAAGIFTWLPLTMIIATAEFRYLLPCVLLSVVSVLILLRMGSLKLFSHLSAIPDKRESPTVPLTSKEYSPYEAPGIGRSTM